MCHETRLVMECALVKQQIFVFSLNGVKRASASQCRQGNGRGRTIYDAFQTDVSRVWISSRRRYIVPKRCTGFSVQTSTLSLGRGKEVCAWNGSVQFFSFVSEWNVVGHMQDKIMHDTHLRSCTFCSTSCNEFFLLARLFTILQVTIELCKFRNIYLLIFKEKRKQCIVGEINSFPPFTEC